MKRRILPLLAVAVVAAACSNSAESEDAAGKRDWFAMMATHHTIETFGSAFFKVMDTNEDGLVTREERAGAPYQQWLVDFSRVDLDGNGSLTEAEYIRALRQAHARPAGQEV